MTRLGWSFLTWVRYYGIFYIKFQSETLNSNRRSDQCFSFFDSILLTKKTLTNSINSEIGLLFVLIYYESHSISRSPFYLKGLRYFFFAEAQTNPLIIWMMVNYNFLCLLNDKSLINGYIAATLVHYIQKNDQKFIGLVVFPVESDLFSPL